MKDPRALKATQALMTSADETEASFYDAMRHGDVDRVMACWAEDEEIACVSPGGPRTVGTVAVRAAFAATLVAGPVHITIEHVRRMETAVCAVHHVTEKVQAMTSEGLQTAFVIATNVYLRTPQGWRMVAHHASPAGDLAEPASGETPSTLH